MAISSLVNYGTMYVRGLSLAYVDAENIKIEPGSCRYKNNLGDIISDTSLNINLNKIGPGGVDISYSTGTLVLYVYMIADSSQNLPVSCMATSDINFTNESEKFPIGYDSYRRIGAVAIKSGDFKNFFQYGKDENRTYFYNDTETVLSANGTGSFVPVSLISWAPAIESEAIFTCAYTYSSAPADNIVEFLPFGSTSTQGIIKLNIQGPSQEFQIKCPYALDGGVNPKILIKYQAADNVKLLISGYCDYL